MMDAPRIFVSYARSDGHAFARKLHDRIREAGLAVWQDLADMEGGNDWWEQIAGFLRRPEVEHLVLVLSPKAVDSEIVRREWRLARQEGVRVTPVIDASNRPDFVKLPRALARAHALDPDVDEQWRQLIRILEGASGQPRVPFLAPEPPAGFVDRPEEYERVKRALIDGKGDAVAITAALRGAGGYGKTSLAARLAHDDDIGEAFFHGILWTTLGESPGDVIGRLNTLTRALNPAAPLETDPDLAVARWREALEQRHCLIVVDDVWRQRDLEPFLVGGGLCARLVTTRDAAVLPRGRGRMTMVPVDAMKSGEAMAMLAHGLEPAAIAVSMRDRLGRLAAAFGEWPLLLRLAQGRIARRVEAGHPLDKALAAIEEAWAAKGIGAFDAHNPDERNAAAAASLDLSIEALESREGTEATTRLEEFGVFAEDQDIPVPLVFRLWQRTGGLAAFDGEDLLLRLRDLSFVERYDSARGVFRLHDVVRTRLRERLGAHRLRVLDREVADVIGDLAARDWRGLKAVPYALEHLPVHLAGAGEDARLEALLSDANWIEARLAAGIAAGEGATGLVSTYAELGRGEVSRGVGRLLAVVGQDLAIDGPDQVIPQLLGNVAKTPGTSLALEAWRRDLRMPALVPIPTTGSLADSPAELMRLRTESRVISIAFSPDGKHLATASEDTMAWLWDVARGREIARFEGCRSVAFSADGTRLATGSWDNTARIWDVGTGAEILRLKGHQGPVWSVAFSGDGSRLATSSWDKTARIWDVGTGTEVQRLEGHGGLVCSVVFSPDGKRLASGSVDDTVRVWDAATGVEITRLLGHAAGVMGVTFASDGVRLATGSWDKTARVWDVETGAEILSLEGHGYGVSSVAFCPQGTLLASGSHDGTGRLWNALTGSEVIRLEGHGGAVRCIAFSPDGRRLATGSDDRTVRLWDSAAGARIAQPEGNRGLLTSVTFSPDGLSLATGSYDGTARLWDVASQKEVGRFEGHDDWVTAVAFSPDGTRLATGSDDRTVRVWDAATGSEIVRLERQGGEVPSVAFHPDGTRLATTSYGYGARIWKVDTGAEIARFAGPSVSPLIVALSPDGALIATGFSDGTTQIWDLASGSGFKAYDSFREVSPNRAHVAKWSGATVRLWEVATGAESLLEGHGAAVATVAFSPDGTRLATGSDDQTARVWDVATGEEIAILRGHRSWVKTVAFSPRGTCLATGSRGGTARIWDLASGLENTRLEGHIGEITSVAFSPDGALLATGSDDQTARVWDVTAGAEIARLGGQVDGVKSVAFSSDGRYLTIRDWSGTARLWDLATGEITSRGIGMVATGAGNLGLEGHNGPIASIAFSPDGTRLATGSWDKTARIWDTATGAEAICLEGHGGEVASVVFSPNGACLVTGSDDRTVRLWDVATGAEIARLRLPSEVRSVAIAESGQLIAAAAGVGRPHLIELIAAGTEPERLGISQ
ncbi:TIR domain-containing protein [Mesorhizobium sp. M0830]|uniref:WD40 domain-containing protein n=1 Tax=Mesorhizobium sp. M0830 TaxID=2957008 RepID=UPI003335F896